MDGIRPTSDATMRERNVVFRIGHQNRRTSSILVEVSSGVRMEGPSWESNPGREVPAEIIVPSTASYANHYTTRATQFTRGSDSGI